jgi:hypothetical protein
MFLSDDDSKPSCSDENTDDDNKDYVPEQDVDVSTNMTIDEANKFFKSRSKGK